MKIVIRISVAKVEAIERTSCASVFVGAVFRYDVKSRRKFVTARRIADNLVDGRSCQEIETRRIINCGKKARWRKGRPLCAIARLRL